MNAHEENAEWIRPRDSRECCDSRENCGHNKFFFFSWFDKFCAIQRKI